jgi:hypothetical protein
MFFKEHVMKKAVKAAVISAGAAAVILAVLFVVIPFASSKEAKARLGAALAAAGISEDGWNAERVYYVPLPGQLVVEKFTMDGVLNVNKITLAIKTNREDLFAGSIDAQGLSFPAGDDDIIVKSLSVKDFSVDTAALMDDPLESVKKLGKVSVSGAAFRRDGQPYVTLGEFNANIGYSAGAIPLPASVTLKRLTADVRRFNALPALRPEYRISTLELKNSISRFQQDHSCKSDLVIDVDDLFMIKTNIGFSFPWESGGAAGFALPDGEDVKLSSLALAYTDKSLLDHVFELAELPGGRAEAAELLNDYIVMLAGLGGIDAERFANETAGFFRKPDKLELKANFESPVRLEDIAQNPFAATLSLSINGGRPFTTGGL